MLGVPDVKATVQDFHNHSVLLRHRYPAIVPPDAACIPDSAHNLDPKHLPAGLRKLLASLYSDQSLESRHTPLVLPTNEMIPLALREGFDVMRRHIYVTHSADIPDLPECDTAERARVERYARLIVLHPKA